MVQSNESRPKKGVGYWMRVAVMFLSFGFVFPHVLTEDMDSRAETK